MLVLFGFPSLFFSFISSLPYRETHRWTSSYLKIKHKMMLVSAFVLNVRCMYIKSTMGSWPGCSKSMERSCTKRAQSFPVSSTREAPRSVLAVSFNVLVEDKAAQLVRHLVFSLPLNRRGLVGRCMSVKNMILCSYCWLQLDLELPFVSYDMF
jgi:hypothetical protein